MKLNVPEAEERAQWRVNMTHGSIAGVDQVAADALALAALLREGAQAAEGAQCPCSLRERESGHRVGCWMPDLVDWLAKARGAGLLPARESAPAEPKEEA